MKGLDGGEARPAPAPTSAGFLASTLCWSALSIGQRSLLVSGQRSLLVSGQRSLFVPIGRTSSLHSGCTTCDPLAAAGSASSSRHEREYLIPYRAMICIIGT